MGCAHQTSAPKTGTPTYGRDWGLVASKRFGSITGKIIDARTQKPVVNAVITATSPSAQGEQTVISDEDGEFEIETLPPGTYLLHLEKEYYKPLNHAGVAVHSGETARSDVELAPDEDYTLQPVPSDWAANVLQNIPVASPNGVGDPVGRSADSWAAEITESSFDAEPSRAGQVFTSTFWDRVPLVR
jgi:hypothetical protein